MIIRDFIMTQPLDEITKQFMKLDDIDVEKYDKVFEMLQELFKNLAKYDVTPSEDILGVLEVNTEDENYHDVILYHKNEILEWKDSPKFNKTFPTLDQVSKLSTEELEPLISERNYPEKYCFNMSPWKNTLGYQINKQNVKQIGPIVYATAYLHELTFFGFEEVDMMEKKEEIDQSIIEFEEIKKLPEEERQKHFHSADEVFKKFGFTDERTEEEKAQAYLNRLRENLTTDIKTHTLLKMIVEDLN